MPKRLRVPTVGGFVGIALMVSGCAVFFTEGEKLVGQVPREPGTNIVLRTTLGRSTHGIRFHSPAAVSGAHDGSRVTVTLANTSESTVISIKGSEGFAQVAPRESATLYDGGVAGLVSHGRFSVSPLGGRVQCELRIRFARAPTLVEPIQVLRWYSSTPL